VLQIKLISVSLVLQLPRVFWECVQQDSASLIDFTVC